MIARFLRPLLWLTLLGALVGLACNVPRGGAPTLTPLPTRLFEPTQEDQSSPAPQSTRETEPTAPAPLEPTAPPPIPTSEAPPALIEFDTQPFVHPQGIFEVRPPLGWTADSDEGSTLFEAPDRSGAIYLQVTNTGYALEEAAFARFIQAREVNFFSGFEAYTELDRQVDSTAGDAMVTKSLLFDGTPQIVVTDYRLHDQFVYSVDFWADRDVYEANRGQYDRFFDAVTVDTSAAARQDKYSWIYTFDGPRSLFRIDVPSAWTYESTSGDFAVVDTFYSPDDHAAIQNIAYDDGQVISKSEAGVFALELLRRFYAEDLRVIEDRVQPDGSERLSWNSPSGDYRGISFFESRGTTFLLFTVMYDNPFEDIYLDVLNDTISTYATP